MKNKKNNITTEDFVIWHDGNDFYKITISNWDKVKNVTDINERKPYSKKLTRSEVEKYVE